MRAAAAAEVAKAAEQSASELPVQADTEAEDLHGMPWRFVITREARQSWASLPDVHRRLVLARLRVIGEGTWVASGLSKLIRMDDRGMQGLELWRLRINKGGRVLFEVSLAPFPLDMNHLMINVSYPYNAFSRLLSNTMRRSKSGPR